jgi:hypothetical protein
MMLGPVLAMVNGPIVAEAIKDPSGRLSKFTASHTDDARVVEEIYLSVLNRRPTGAEKAAGVKALRSASADHARLMAAFKQDQTALQGYEAKLDGKQHEWENRMRAQRPTEWTVLRPTKATSKNGGTPAVAKAGATLTVNKDGSILASGKTGAVDIYTVVGEAKLKGAVTGLRLEVLSDPSLPSKGPGRAENGNFVLNEFKVGARPLEKDNAKPKPVKLTGPKATFEQGGFPVRNAIDNNPATGWAVAQGTGKNQTAIFRFQRPVNVAEGVELRVVMDQRYGSNHVIGKFRLSVTTDKQPKLGAPVSAEVLKMLDTPADKRTAAVKAKLRQMYVAQDAEYQRLKAEASKAPPADARVLGAQDLVWALINSPAFLFNH